MCTYVFPDRSQKVDVFGKSDDLTRAALLSRLALR